ncbi:MAG: hypothetical protein WA726_06505 [Acidimicrobiia bacterium]
MNSVDVESSPAVGFRIAVVVVAILGVVSILMALAHGPTYWLPITDFGRDLLGASAASHGANPYEQIGALAAGAPRLSIGTGADDLWVVHSPVALFLAWVWLRLVGPVLAAPTADFLQGTAMVALVAGLGYRMSQRASRWHGLLWAGALCLSLGFVSDAFWVQGAALLGLGLVVALALERGGMRGVALVLLGLLVAWRPWLAPLAVALPNSRSAFRDAVTVWLTAVLATLVVLPVLGGWHILGSWLFDALPGNLDYYGPYPWNFSVIGRHLPAVMATAVFGVATLAAGKIRHMWEPEDRLLLAVLVIVLFAPLFWAQYWLALSPIVLVRARSARLSHVLLVVLLMAWPFAITAFSARLGSYAAALFLLVCVARLRIKDATPKVEPVTNIDRPALG